MIQSGEPLTTKLICPVPGCGCIILGKEGAVKDLDFVLEPKVTFPALPKGVPSSEPTESSNFTYLWKVKDKMDFWNIAFSLVHPESGHRMLACADCEVGPIGFQPQGMETCFIIPDRVLVKE